MSGEPSSRRVRQRPVLSGEPPARGAKQAPVSMHRRLEILAAATAPIAAIWALSRASSGLDVAGLFAAAAGYVAADFVCGAIHWYCDERADASWKWIGPAFIRPFRDHHERPEAIADHDVFELCGNNALACVAILGATLPWAPLAPHLAIGVAAFALAILATNVFHKWAHASAPPRLSRALQKARLVLSPEEHSRHHASLDRAYCVTSGWTNPILDAAIRRVRSRDRRS